MYQKVLTKADLFKLHDDRDAVVLIAYYIMGWTQAEIARELGITRERVRQIRTRAIKRLGIAREVLERHDSWHLFLYRRRH